ncbi:efflux RND transporter periplasmic adaptor subunit [Flexistipes sp.]|uniref:efflux RND transporter periplasmic adaptor subunit n=1 Tax=Flexistipes sp. TaxID=3088135 RepID=UPI002E21F7D3|nr:efflux RND transporter periplasmic adaptor subunit [Flexistipes sp.]
MDEQQKNKRVEEESKTLPKKTWWQRLLSFIMIVFIIGAGVYGVKYFLSSRPMPQISKPEKIIPTVTVKDIKPSEHRVSISAYGNVKIKNDVEIKSQVSGIVTYVSDKLDLGEFVKAGEILVKIDKTDYEIALEKSLSALEQAQSNLTLEKGKQSVAKKEWEIMQKRVGDNISKEQKALALRVPQLMSARAAVKQAEADVRKARLDLKRTVIRSPFNGIVMKKNVSKGSYLNVQGSVARIISTEDFYVEAYIEKEKLKWLDKSKPVMIESGAGKFTGKVEEVLPDVQDKGLMAKLLITVNNPLQSDPPLLVGDYAEVIFKGKILKDIYKIPRSAVSDRGKIYLVDSEYKLRIKEYDKMWEDEKYIYVKNTFPQEWKLVVSKIFAPSDGMKVKVSEENAGASR